MSKQNKTLATRGNMNGTASPRMPGVVRWSMYILFFSLCFENFDLFGGSAFFTISKMAGILFAVACFWKAPRVFISQHWTIQALTWLWLVLAIATMIAELSHPIPRSAFVGVMLSLTQCFMLYWLCVNIFRDRQTTAYGLLAFAYSAALMSLLMKLGIGRQTIQESEFFQRVSFLGANSNMIAIWAATGIIIVTSLVTGNQLRWGSWRYGLLLFITPMLTVMTESGSRGAAISLVLAMVCFLFAGGSWYKRSLIGIAVLGVYLGLFYISKDSVLVDRLQRTANTGTMAGREEIWPSALKMIALTFTTNFVGCHWPSAHLWTLAVEEQF